MLKTPANWTITTGYAFRGTSTNTSMLVSNYSSTVNVNGSFAITSYVYTYDVDGNITQISDSNGKVISYVYDDLGQLTRENNQVLGKTYVYTYDNGGNRTSKKTYAYTTGTLGTATETESYTYSAGAWKDQLTQIKKNDVVTATFSYDAIGNPTTFNEYNLTWHGRQLKEMNRNADQYVLEFKYNADGIRTNKIVNGEENHIYTLNGSQIVSEEWDGNLLIYLYDESGSPIGMQYRTTSYAAYTFDTFYFEKNLQGDIVAVYNANGVKVLSYTYDAWGNHTFTWVNRTPENMPAVYNPFRYRGYYYDTETQLYYLQSRYYNPAWGRFLNVDGLVSTGTGILGYNMYTYCDNNPVMRTDYGGTNWFSDIWEKIKNFFSDNFGATASIGQEESEEIQLGLAKVDTGIGYSKSFDTGKAANVYVSAGEDWKELDEYSAGFDVNINGYGANIEIGTDTSFGVHLNKISIDFGQNSTGNSYIQITSETENGEYAYTKFSINTWNCAVVALAVIFAPYALPALAPAIVGS